MRGVVVLAGARTGRGWSCMGGGGGGGGWGEGRPRGCVGTVTHTHTTHTVHTLKHNPYASPQHARSGTVRARTRFGLGLDWVMARARTGLGK